MNTNIDWEEFPQSNGDSEKIQQFLNHLDTFSIHPFFPKFSVEIQRVRSTKAVLYVCVDNNKAAVTDLYMHDGLRGWGTNLKEWEFFEMLAYCILKEGETRLPSEWIRILNPREFGSKDVVMTSLPVGVYEGSDGIAENLKGVNCFKAMPDWYLAQVGDKRVFFPKAYSKVEVA